MKVPRIRWTLALGGEVALALGLCVLSYGLVMGVLGMVFPSSTGLRDLLDAKAGGGAQAVTAVARALRGSGMIGDATESPAVLQVLNPRVTRKQADAVAWVPARSGIRLRGRDGVQTASSGIARIDFDDANRLRLGPSTLVIIRETVEELDRPARQASVLMLEGDLWADVATGAEGRAMTLRVATPAGEARVAPAGEAAARVRVSVDREKASTFSVYEGEARIRTREGSVVVGANQAVAVDSTGEASAPRALPAAPALAAPADGIRIARREMPPPVTFSWREVPGAAAYRFTLAGDAAFRRIIADATVTGTAHRQQGLGDGTYFWRVSARAGGIEGAPAPARRLSIERTARGGPRLEVELPPSIVRGNRFVLEGVTSPSARVMVSDVPVAVDGAGRFRHEVALKPGMNVIVIEAVDTDGHTTYQSAIVNAKP